MNKMRRSDLKFIFGSVATFILLDIMFWFFTPMSYPVTVAKELQQVKIVIFVIMNIVGFGFVIYALMFSLADLAGAKEIEEDF